MKLRLNHNSNEVGHYPQNIKAITFYRPHILMDNHGNFLDRFDCIWGGLEHNMFDDKDGRTIKKVVFKTWKYSFKIATEIYGFRLKSINVTKI